jgi:ubiquinol oxidase
MVSSMVRHLHSLRTLKRDHGWISTLMGEAENERMHLLTFMEMRSPKPGVFMRGSVLAVQGIFTNAYFLAYLLAPSACHRFVGFLEEEAVHTYTNAIAELEAGKLPEWTNAPAPPIAVTYWRLKPGATVLDVLYAVRADEAIHRDVNHVLAETDREEGDNPFKA